MGYTGSDMPGGESCPVFLSGGRKVFLCFCKNKGGYFSDAAVSYEGFLDYYFFRTAKNKGLIKKTDEKADSKMNPKG